MKYMFVFKIFKSKYYKQLRKVPVVEDIKIASRDIK